MFINKFMIDSLLHLLKSWTPEKLVEYTQNLRLPDLPERNSFIQEKVHNGLAIYSNEALRYIGDDGVFVSITLTEDDTCYNALCNLYNDKRLRTVQPVNRIHIDGYEIVELRNEFDEPGIPFFGELISDTFNENYWIEYINCVAKLIEAISDNNLKYPSTFVNPHKFVRDAKGLFFNPYIFSLDHIKFTNNKTSFLKSQHQQIGYLLFAYPEAIHMPKIQQMNWNLIKQEAINQWPR
jgi:hypothetical protein